LKGCEKVVCLDFSAYYEFVDFGDHQSDDFRVGSQSKVFFDSHEFLGFIIFQVDSNRDFALHGSSHKFTLFMLKSSMCEKVRKSEKFICDGV